ncbi:MAG: glycosyltransferase family 2 protein [Methylibium sp.]|nr:glycosyltransferase family 2 protein [Methylibium sp.]
MTRVIERPAANAPLRVCVLMTCFNRRDSTLACLQAIEASTGLGHVQLSVVLVDDDSTDGTAFAVRQAHPWVTVIESEGGLYWCRGMHRAFAHALQFEYDHYVWLNDDTFPQPDALARLLACTHDLTQGRPLPVVAVGSVVHPITRQLTYGGERRVSRLRPLSLRRVRPLDHLQPVDTMNGNLVLVNALAAARVGNLDPAFEHAMGDIDYGLRARDAGVGVWLAPGVHGQCSSNDIRGTFQDASLGLGRRWRLMMARKGLPWRSWLRLTQRHAGLMWPLYFVWPYVRLVGETAWFRRSQMGSNQ